MMLGLVPERRPVPRDYGGLHSQVEPYRETPRNELATVQDAVNIRGDLTVHAVQPGLLLAEVTWCRLGCCSTKSRPTT